MTAKTKSHRTFAERIMSNEDNKERSTLYCILYFVMLNSFKFRISQKIFEGKDRKIDGS